MVPVSIDGSVYHFKVGTTFLDHARLITGKRNPDQFLVYGNKEVPWSTPIPGDRGVPPLHLVDPEDLDKMELVGKGTFACVVPQQPCETLLKGELKGRILPGRHVSRFATRDVDAFTAGYTDYVAKIPDLNALFPQGLCRASEATLAKVRTVCPKAEPVFTVHKKGGPSLGRSSPYITKGNAVAFFNGALTVFGEVARLEGKGYVHGDISARNILVDQATKNWNLIDPNGSAVVFPVQQCPNFYYAPDVHIAAVAGMKPGPAQDDAIHAMAHSGSELVNMEELTEKSAVELEYDVRGALELAAVGVPVPTLGGDVYSLGMAIALAAAALDDVKFALIDSGYFRGALHLSPYRRDSADASTIKYMAAMHTLQTSLKAGEDIAAGKLVPASTRDVCHISR